jgi:hypothetical protein
MNKKKFNNFLIDYKGEGVPSDLHDVRKIYPLKKASSQILGSPIGHVKEMFKSYFKEPGSVLDIGGSAGNLLYNNEDNFITKYSCLDVVPIARDYGKYLYPDSNFYFYDKFNWIYNITGDPNTMFPDIEEHDYTFFYNVAISCDYNDLIETLKFAIKRTKKKIIFNVHDKNQTDMLELIYNRYHSTDISGTSFPLQVKEDDNKISYLLATSRKEEKRTVNDIQVFNQDKFTPSNETLKLKSCSAFYSFYDIDYLRKRLVDTFNCKIEISNPDTHTVTFELCVL